MVKKDYTEKHKKLQPPLKQQINTNKEQQQANRQEPTERDLN